MSKETMTTILMFLLFFAFMWCMAEIEDRAIYRHQLAKHGAGRFVPIKSLTRTIFDLIAGEK